MSTFRRSSCGFSLPPTYEHEAGREKRAASEPCDTLTRENKLSLVVPYMRTSKATPAELEPAATIPGTDRLSLVVSDEAAPVTITDEDVDACRFRMFSIQEIARAMSLAFHPNGSPYVALGNKRERMAQYGNAVTPPAMEWLLGRVLEQVMA